MAGALFRSNSDGHIYGLDGLRAIAIIGVTLFHMFPDTFQGGYLGTSLFFVLSGYLLAVTTEKRAQNGEFSVSSFYKKRVKRIYPGLLLVLLITVGVYFIIDNGALGGIRPEMLSVVGGVDNWWQIAQNADYFSKIANASPFTHLWFLSIEMQFYLIWPLIVMVIYRLLGRKRGSNAGLWFMLIVTAVSVVVSLIMFQPGTDVTRIYYGTDTRLYSLTFGVCLGLANCRGRLIQIRKKSIERLAFPMLITLLVLTFIAYFFMNGQYDFTYRGGMLLMTLLFGILLVLTVDKRVPIGYLLEWGPLAWIGKRSFEIYLWQYPVIFLFMDKGWIEDHEWLYIVEGILLLVLAAALHYITESLLQKNISFMFRVGAVVCIALSICGVIGIATADSEKPGKMDELAAHLEEQEKMLEELEKESEAVSGGAVSGDAADDEEDDEEDDISFEKPKLKYGDISLKNSAPVSKKRVFMVGDSILLSASRAVLKELPGAKIDAKNNRMVPVAIDSIKKAKKAGKINKTVVIALGTNGVIKMDVAEKILDLLGKDVSVFWVNLFGKTVTWRKSSNNILKKLEEKHSNLSVIDWCSLIKDRKDKWLWPDGDHPNQVGEKVYARLIRESIEAAGYNQRKAEQKSEKDE